PSPKFLTQGGRVRAARVALSGEDAQPFQYRRSALLDEFPFPRLEFGLVVSGMTYQVAGQGTQVRRFRAQFAVRHQLLYLSYGVGTQTIKGHDAGGCAQCGIGLQLLREVTIDALPIKR